MRRRLFAALAAALAIGWTASLAPPASASELHRGNLAEPDTLDPAKWFTTYENWILSDLFNGLLQQDAEGNSIPGAAESWTVSDDGLTLTFRLRADGRWSDGAPVTAEDFVVGFRRSFDPRTASAYANFGYVIVNAREIVEGRMPLEALGVRAIDALTFEVKLNEPSQTLLPLFASYPNFFPAPAHVLAKEGDGWVQPGKMVSNGPYRLVEWVPQDRVTLEKNEAYFDAASVRIDKVYYYPTDDDTSAVKRFRAGELDINMRFPPSLYAMLKRDLPSETRTYPASWIGYIVFNHAELRFADARVRRALSIAIDRETIAKRVLNNGELPAWSFVPPGTRHFVSSGAGDFSAMPMSERQGEARRLLAEAGYGPGNTLAFTFMHRAGEANKRAALAVADMWKAVGVDVRIEANEVKTHYARLREKAFEVADGGFSAQPDAEYFIYLLRSDSTEVNFGGWANADYDRLANAGNRERDLVRRGELYAAAEKIALDETALIPVYIPVNRALVQNWVSGFQPNPNDAHPTRWMSVDR
ncbi:MAG: peptide ABC transporter substrate-binding protein [Alphaproteobacteria bacterium]|nr:peptide ABC transporter substrate-binding protein [Alphaproteobacteria bacterium]